METENNNKVVNFNQNKKVMEFFGLLNSKDFIKCKSAFTLYKEELLENCILSYNEKLDELLKNVVVSGQITEFTGHFEATNPLCLRLCISVQLPRICGGCEGEAFYLSTTGNFSIEKLREMALNFVEEYCKNTDDFTTEHILNRIHYAKINNTVELIASLCELERFLFQKNIRLLVIDSISYVLRQLEVAERFKSMNSIITFLRKLAASNNMAVIITNFCTTRINQDEAYTVPSFGDSFYHMINSRISFTKSGRYFHAKLLKNLFHREKEAIYIL